jgi:hypothetical protein
MRLLKIALYYKYDSDMMRAFAGNERVPKPDTIRFFLIMIYNKLSLIFGALLYT